MDGVFHTICVIVVFGISAAKLHCLRKDREFLEKFRTEQMIHSLEVLCIGIALSCIFVVLASLWNFPELSLVSLIIIGVVCWVIYKICH
ncbi:hypothetical protein HMPREF9477_00358 [Lachnospiraceae bacterium 2_1_46FAA]|nr:hypothetical protein HMPREF9477_00358 [Lachnospiraceae bacterium 2_1_46FAA]